MAKNSAQRAAKLGRKRQQRKKVAQLHKLEHFVVRNAPAAVANPLIRRIEKRERLNKLANHTRKADRNAGETGQNTPHNSEGAA